MFIWYIFWSSNICATVMLCIFRECRKHNTPNTVYALCNILIYIHCVLFFCLLFLFWYKYIIQIKFCYLILLFQIESCICRNATHNILYMFFACAIPISCYSILNVVCVWRLILLFLSPHSICRMH